MKKLLTTSALILLSVPALAADYSPSYGSATSITGNDSFRSRDGASCSASVLGPTLNIGAASQSGTEYDAGAENGDKDHGYANTVFATVSIPLGAKDETRLDCSKLYNIELERAALELQQLKDAIAQQKQALAAVEKNSSKEDGVDIGKQLFGDDEPAVDLFASAEPEKPEGESVSIKDLLGDK